MHGGRRGKGRCGLGLGGRRGRGCGLSRMLGLSRNGGVCRGSSRLHLVAANRTETSAVVNLGATTGTEHIGYLLGVEQQVVRTFGGPHDHIHRYRSKVVAQLSKCFLRFRPRRLDCRRMLAIMPACGRSSCRRRGPPEWARRTRGTSRRRRQGRPVPRPSRERPASGVPARPESRPWIYRNPSRT